MIRQDGIIPERKDRLAAIARCSVRRIGVRHHWLHIPQPANAMPIGSHHGSGGGEASAAPIHVSFDHHAEGIAHG